MQKSMYCNLLTNQNVCNVRRPSDMFLINGSSGLLFGPD